MAELRPVLPRVAAKFKQKNWQHQDLELCLRASSHISCLNSTIITCFSSEIDFFLPHGARYYLESWLSLSLSKNILLSYENRRFITVFTQARHWSLS
jgi:hypothetical protein